MQPGRRPGLAAEALQAAGVEQSMPGQHLDGHAPVQGDLLGLVDDAHAAAAQLPENLELTQMLVSS